MCGEISCISKSKEQLIGHAKDPISSGLAWQAFVPVGYWGQHQAEVLCLGAGGAALALSVFVASLPDPEDRPLKFTVVDINPARLDELRDLHQKLEADLKLEPLITTSPEENDRLLAELPSRSMVINATGMGKDRPGSPLTDQARFPKRGLVWELNYRGQLDFLHQAKRQAEERALHLEDGWVYFLHGWSQVIAEVFQIDLTPERFAALDQAALSIRQ